jgi:hypothetical protein
MHCTCVWDLGQVPYRGALPIVRLKEIGLRQRSGNETVVVANPSYGTGLKRRELPSLTTRILVRELPDAG